jgi:magnesium-transporting ATPase (P-type)
VRIYQENAELVGVIGSVQKGENASTFAQADVAVALQPLPAWRCSWVGLDPRPKQPRLRDPRGGGGGGGAVGGRWAGRAEGMAAAPLLDTLHCAGVLPGDHDLEQLTEWLLQGRSLLTNTKQALAFGLFSSLLLMLLQLGAAWAGLPPPLTTAHLLWLLLLVAPVLALPLLLASIDPRNKKEMVPKNEDHLKDGPRLGSYLFLRALPGAVGLNLLFASLLATVELPPPAPFAPPPPPAPLPLLTADGTLATVLPSCLSAASLGPAAASDQHVLVCQQVV